MLQGEVPNPSRLERSHTLRAVPWAPHIWSRREAERVPQPGTVLALPLGLLLAHCPATHAAVRDEGFLADQDQELSVAHRHLPCGRLRQGLGGSEVQLQWWGMLLS